MNPLVVPTEGAITLPMAIHPQPDDASCGPTCLHAIYRYYRDTLSHDAVLREIPHLPTGGTLAVTLANHALARGYRARIFTYNLTVFDPTWFQGGSLDQKLRAQAELKDDPRLREATRAYLAFVAAGGRLAFEDLTDDLIARHLSRGCPILTGLSATFLYRCSREVGERELRDDDLRGHPSGHFVVLCGWDPIRRLVRVADPLGNRPQVPDHLYWLPVDRVINAILLGVLTYDANLLVVQPVGSEEVA